MKELTKETTIAVIGMDYVGMPMSIEFAEKYHVIGFDINERKIEDYISGTAPTNEVGNDRIKS